MSCTATFLPHTISLEIRWPRTWPKFDLFGAAGWIAERIAFGGLALVVGVQIGRTLIPH